MQDARFEGQPPRVVCSHFSSSYCGLKRMQALQRERGGLGSETLGNLLVVRQSCSSCSIVRRCFPRETLGSHGIQYPQRRGTPLSLSACAERIVACWRLLLPGERTSADHCASVRPSTAHRPRRNAQRMQVIHSHRAKGRAVLVEAQTQDSTPPRRTTRRRPERARSQPPARYAAIHCAGELDTRPAYASRSPRPARVPVRTPESCPKDSSEQAPTRSSSQLLPRGTEAHN